MMRQSINNGIIALLIILLCGVSLFAWMGWDDAQRVETERPTVSSMTRSPEIPSSIVFCGKKVDLTRYNMREGMDRELTSFTYFHSTTMLLIKRANRYFPIIEPILKSHGIPDDFKYLAVIESHLDPSAVSPARAAGMWQFLASTGKEYGLTITSTVDERYHVERSTHAACRYLKEAHARTHDWIMAAMAYNGGMSRITSAQSKQQVTSGLDLWLVEETIRYAYRIMAVKLLFENPYKYGFVLNTHDLYRPMASEEVSVTRDIPDLIAFAKNHHITYADLKRFNPWLRDTKLEVGKRKYKIRIPKKGELYYDRPNRYLHDARWVKN